MKKAYKYQIVKEERAGTGRMMYFIRAIAVNGAKSEQWIGQNKLKRLYEQDKLIGHMSDTIRHIVGREPKKPKGRGKVFLEPRQPKEVVESHWISDKAEITKPKGWSLNEVWVAPEVELAPKPKI